MTIASNDRRYFRCIGEQMKYHCPLAWSIFCDRRLSRIILLLFTRSPYSTALMSSEKYAVSRDIEYVPLETNKVASVIPTDQPPRASQSADIPITSVFKVFCCTYGETLTVNFEVQEWLWIKNIQNDFLFCTPPVAPSFWTKRAVPELPNVTPKSNLFYQQRSSCFD